MLGTILITLAGSYFALDAKVTQIKQAVETHTRDTNIHPSVLERQALIDERILLKEEAVNEWRKRIEEKIDLMREDMREMQGKRRVSRSSE